MPGHPLSPITMQVALTPFNLVPTEVLLIFHIIHVQQSSGFTRNQQQSLLIFNPACHIYEEPGGPMHEAN